MHNELLSTEVLASTFDRISTETRNVSALIHQIAVAGEEQSSTMSEVSKTIDGMHTVSEQSAIGIQHIAEATSELNNLTEHLRKLVEQFSGDQQKPADNYRANGVSPRHAHRKQQMAYNGVQK